MLPWTEVTSSLKNRRMGYSRTIVWIRKLFFFSTHLLLRGVFVFFVFNSSPRTWLPSHIYDEYDSNDLFPQTKGERINQKFNNYESTFSHYVANGKMNGVVVCERCERKIGLRLQILPHSEMWNKTDVTREIRRERCDIYMHTTTFILSTCLTQKKIKKNKKLLLKMFGNLNRWKYLSGRAVGIRFGPRTSVRN